MDTHRINEMEQRLGRATAAVDAIGTPFCITVDNDTHAAGARQYQPATRLSKRQTLVDNINERKTGKKASLFYLFPFIFSITSRVRNTALFPLAL